MDDLKKQISFLLLSDFVLTPVKKSKPAFLPDFPNLSLSEEEMFSFVDNGYQLGICTGARSGITVVDVDFAQDGMFGTDPDIFPDTYTVRTPSGAIQKYYQYNKDIHQTQNSFGTYPHVDIRNDGGYVVAPPSKVTYTKTYKNDETGEVTTKEIVDGEYSVISGSITDLAPFPLDLFKDYVYKEENQTQSKVHTFNKARPGDDFEQSVSWEQILTPNGWIKSYTDKKGGTHWTRPQKKGDATSATTRMSQDGRERLFVFSTSAMPFEAYDKVKRNSYTKISAYALLNHSGDFQRAIERLRSEGYGLQYDKEIDQKESNDEITIEDVSQFMEMTCLNDIEEIPIDWVWKGKIARGELSIIAGEPGAGKTMIVADIAARISNGDNAPFSNVPLCKGSVVFLTSENDPEKVLRPRLIAAGANLKKIHLLSSSINKEENGKKIKRHVALAEDAEKIGQAVSRCTDAVALIIDPISEYMGKKDANNNADVRDMLATLTDHIRAMNVAIIVVTHFNKKMEVTSSSSRINGSIGLAGAARTAFAVGKYYDDNWSDEEKDARFGQMAFASIKNNLSGDKSGYVYGIKSYDYDKDGKKIETACVEWKEEMQASADDMLSKNSGKNNRKITKKSLCLEWLEKLLKKYGSDGVMKSEVIEIGEDEGFTQRTIERAAEDLPLKDTKDKGRWILDIAF